MLSEVTFMLLVDQLLGIDKNVLARSMAAYQSRGDLQLSSDTETR